jgi:L-asparaginase
VRATPYRRVVITHGTDTMIDTARALTSVSGKAIVLTGAMQPVAFKETDAPFNVGCAIAAVQVLPEGVYLVMNGRIFDPQTIRKDVARDRFVEI